MPVIKTPQANLKAKYGIYLKVSFILSLTLLIAAFKFSPKQEIEEVLILKGNDIIKIEDVINTVQKREPPPLPKKPEPVSKPDEVVENQEYKSNELDQDEIISSPQQLSNRPIFEEENVPFLWVEKMPEPVGGLASLREKIKYTEIARRTGIEGKVIIEVTIGRDGKPFNAMILKGIGGGLDEVALNAVLQTKFKPGLQRDKPVSVRMIIPIKFELR